MRFSAHFTGLRRRRDTTAEQVLFGVDVDLAAEAATDLGRDRADLILAEAVIAAINAQDVRLLRRGPDRHRALPARSARRRRAPPSRSARAAGSPGAAMTPAARRPRYGRVVHEPDPPASHPCGSAGAPREVAGSSWMTVGLPGHRELGIHHRGERIVRDDDRMRRVARQVAIPGDDDRDRLADVAHAALGDGAMLRRRERRADRHRREELGDQLAGEHSLHALHRVRGAGVDLRDPALRELAALEGDVLHADELQSST